MRKQKRDSNTLRDLKADLGAVAGLLAFLAIMVSAAVLPGLLADRDSTVGSPPVREAHR